MDLIPIPEVKEVEESLEKVLVEAEGHITPNMENKDREGRNSQILQKFPSGGT